MDRLLAHFVLLAAQYVASAEWYAGLEGIKILHPDMSKSEFEALVDSAVHNTTQFGTQRTAILVMPGEYPQNLYIPVGYYTSIVGVGRLPSDVRLGSVRVGNDISGHALNNFWRSCEGVTLTAPRSYWAVSQASPLRRMVVEKDLWLSQSEGYSSGGFFADIDVGGTLVMGTQQQWFGRNARVQTGLECWTGWNYVFVGVKGIDAEAVDRCQWAGDVPKGQRRHGWPGRISAVTETPRIAEKPYLVKDGSKWFIYVPKFVASSTAGPIEDREAGIARKLELTHEVFVATPEMTAFEINMAMQGKDGLLLTPGVYVLTEPLVVKESHFVVLGLGFATLVSPIGLSCIEVLDDLDDVRVAGLVLESGTPAGFKSAQPLLRWGLIVKPTEISPSAPGIASDIFARVGSFRHIDCTPMRVGTMLEFNANGVVVDNVWAWHADHDDCSGFDPGRHSDMASYSFMSDKSHSTHGVVVNGHFVTTYGMAIEHVAGGHMCEWNGEYGQSFFFQAELPYHTPPVAGAVSYKVNPTVLYHFATGLGIYIIGTYTAPAAIDISPFSDVRNVVTAVISGNHSQFASQICQRWESSWFTHKLLNCSAPISCSDILCWSPTVPHLNPTQLPQLVSLGFSPSTEQMLQRMPLLELLPNEQLRTASAEESALRLPSATIPTATSSKQATTTKATTTTTTPTTPPTTTPKSTTDRLMTILTGGGKNHKAYENLGTLYGWFSNKKKASIKKASVSGGSKDIPDANVGSEAAERLGDRAANTITLGLIVFMTFCAVPLMCLSLHCARPPRELRPVSSRQALNEDEIDEQTQFVDI